MAWSWKTRPARAAALAGALAAVGLVGGCLIGSSGIVPPTKQIYFPTAMVVSPGRTTLYVANSDFDLQFNGGTVQALALGGNGGLRTTARTVANQLQAGATQSQACTAIGAKPNDQAFQHPGPCTALSANPFIQKSATIGAFASSATILSRSDGQPGQRLFLAVRGDPSVTYFDVTDDRDPSNLVAPCSSAICLECGAAASSNRCGRSHLIGTDPFTNPRLLLLPTEPAGIDGTAIPVESGDALVVANQTTASASLVVNRWPGASATGPTLEFVLPNLASDPISVTAIPLPRYAQVAAQSTGYLPSFIISHQNAADLTVVQYQSDEQSRPARPFISLEAIVPVTLSNIGTDQRGIAIDATLRQACEATCAATDLMCMQNCVAIPLDLYVASRSPAALLVGQIVSTIQISNGQPGIRDSFSLTESFPLTTGPSLVRIGKVVGPDGTLQPRVFVVSFDGRYIFGFDPTIRDFDIHLKTGRGPFGLGIDAGTADDGSGAEAYLYVGHFTESYIGVVDLDTRRPTYGSFLVNVGPPAAPREDQSP